MPLLKENPKSLRLYFGVIAAISLYCAVAPLMHGPLPSLEVVFSVVNIVFGVLFAYIAFKFSVLLPTKPAFIKRILGASLLASVVGFALSLPDGLQLGQVGALILAVLITVYLTKSVTRLSGVAASKTGQA